MPDNNPKQVKFSDNIKIHKNYETLEENEKIHLLSNSNHIKTPPSTSLNVTN
jgi:hypothetical protein